MEITAIPRNREVPIAWFSVHRQAIRAFHEKLRRPQTKCTSDGPAGRVTTLHSLGYNRGWYTMACSRFCEFSANGRRHIDKGHTKREDRSLFEFKEEISSWISPFWPIQLHHCITPSAHLKRCASGSGLCLATQCAPAEVRILSCFHRFAFPAPRRWTCSTYDHCLSLPWLQASTYNLILQSTGHSWLAIYFIPIWHSLSDIHPFKLTLGQDVKRRRG